MPINYALLLCIPIGLLAYFEARWMSRFLLGRFEERERRAAWLVGAYGALIVPLIYICGVAGDTLSGRIGKFVGPVLFALISLVFVGPMFRVLFERARDDVTNR
jgi:branched-subunit amino acid permease